MHIIADRNMKKLSLHLIISQKKRVELYELLYFSAMSEAILLYTVVAIGPIPPEIETTIEVCKGAMLDFSHPLFVRPLLLLLVPLVALHWGLITIRGGMWVKYYKESPALFVISPSRAPTSEFAVL